MDGGWAYADWPDRRPHRRYLDAAVPDRPVVLLGRDGHMLVANSAALALAGITAKSVDPVDGRIVRDSAGEPSGELTGHAMELVQRIEPRPDVELIRSWLRRDMNEAASLGITSAQMMHGFDPPTEEALLRLVGVDELTLRLALGVMLPEPGQPVDSAIGKARELRARWPGPLVKFGVVKGILDGTIDARTGQMLEPLTDGSNGFGYYKVDELDRLVALYDHEGFQVALHATGDGSIRQALDAFEFAQRQNGPAVRRPRIEHIDVPTPSDLERLRPLGAIPSSQPNFGYPNPTNIENYAKLLGDRMSHAQVYATLDRYSPVQPFSSDFPVSSMDPLKAMHTAVTRTDVDGQPRGGWYPAERIGIEAALRHYTADGAYASFDEKIKGTLTPGKFTDFAVLSQDILGAPASLLTAHVVQTVMGGRTTFRSAVDFNVTGSLACASSHTR